MTDFIKKLTRIERSIVNDVSLERGTIQIRLTIKDRSKRVIFNLGYVFYLLNSLSTLINLSLINDADILNNKVNSKLLVLTQ